MDVADFIIFGAGLFACRFSGAFDEAAIRDEVLDSGEAMDVVDFVEEDEGEDLSDIGDGS